MKARAVIVAENLQTGAGLEGILAGEAEYQVVARFISPPALLEAARVQTQRASCEWDLVLMELSASEWNGVDASRQLREILPEIPILLFTVLSAPEADDPGKASREAGELALLPAARSMLRRLRSLTVAPPSGQTSSTRKHRTRGGLRASTLDLYTRLIRKKRS
jgi:CheY-like chemotaxis protein